MKAILKLLGSLTFWLSWPVWFVYLRRSQRTRVLLVTNDGRVLLTRSWYGPNVWSLPGGGIHGDEDPAFAAARELMEETNVALGTDQLQPLTRATHRMHGLSFDCHYFYAPLNKPIRAQPKLPEVLDVEWVPLAELDAHKLGADTERALSAWRALVQ